MARWRLTNAHYLNCRDTKWEYSEVDRSTGKQVRKQFDVPRYLNPGEPTDWTHRLGRDEGDIYVSDGKNPDPKDIIFVGSPTPDMEPIDEAAKALSASFAERWQHPIESLPGNFTQSLLDKFQTEVAKVQSASTNTPPTGMGELMTAMAELMKQNAALIAMLAPKVESPTAPARRA